MSETRSITINGHGYTHVNADVKLTPLFGPSAGLPFTIKSADDLEYSNKAKHVGIGGTQVGPLQLGVGKAEPDWKMSISKLEFNSLIAHIGPGYLVRDFNVTVTWQVPGRKKQTDYWEGCLMEEDGVKSKVGDAAMNDMSGKCTKVKLNGIDPFNPG